MASKPTPHFEILGPGPWSDRAACRAAEWGTMDYVGNSTRGQRAHVSRAVALCTGCPVLAECRDWALSSPDPVPWSIAGGLTPHERNKRRKGRL